MQHRNNTKLHFAIVLFNGFETLDVFGPVEMFGFQEEDYEIEFYSSEGGLIRSYHNVRVQTLPFSEIPKENYVFFVPGGRGTRTLLNDEGYLNKLKPLAKQATYVMTVCTGSGLLAKAGLLKGKKATTNKMAYDIMTALDSEVIWIKQARWVVDGNYYTSSGVSAGMDMALAFIAEHNGMDTAKDVARKAEYIWNEDPNNDPFAANNTLC